MKNYAALAFTDNAKRIYEKISKSFDGEASISLITVNDIGALWDKTDAFIFICASGIAVRHIAPFINDKLTDPAVLVMDELGMNVIPLLSGHVGGANELAGRIADKLSCNAVITTATDINGTLAIDEWAVNNNLKINNKSGIKKVAMKLLNGEDVDIAANGSVIISNQNPDEECDLWLSPKRQFVVGMGCKKGTSFEKLKDILEETLRELGIENSEVKALASIDLKMEEDGLLELSNDMDIPIYFYSADELKAVPGDFDESSFVESITGVSDVSARAAKCCGRVGNFALKKKKHDGMTISVFEKYQVIRIGNEEN